MHLWTILLLLRHTCIALRPLEIMIEETANYAKERKIFGKSVLDHQVVHFRLAELQTEIESLRSMLYRAAGGVMTSLLNCSQSVVMTQY